MIDFLTHEKTLNSEESLVNDFVHSNDLVSKNCLKLMNKKTQKTRCSNSRQHVQSVEISTQLNLNKELSLLGIFSESVTAPPNSWWWGLKF